MAVIICIAGAFACFLFGAYVGLTGYESLLSVGGKGSSQVDQARNHLSDLGNFGSFFQGPVASVWALAGVFLILATFINQEGQLTLQRDALVEQRAQSVNQNEATTKQNFESTFFQLLNLQNQIASEMKITVFVKTGSGGTTSGIDRIIEGRDCFEQWFANLKMHILRRTSVPFLRESLEREPKEVTDAELTPLVRAGYESFYKEHLANLGQYFNNFYHLIEFVKRSEMTDKQWYANLAAAQLSSYELALLFYHGLSPSGEVLRPLIQGFGLLKNIDKGLIPKEHVDFYGAL